VIASARLIVTWGSGDADLVQALLDRCGQRGLVEADAGGDRDVGAAGVWRTWYSRTCEARSSGVASAEGARW